VVAGVVVFATVAVGVGTWSNDPPPLPPTPQTAPVPTPEYDEALEPSAAVLALVPTTASTLLVTDYEQVRLQMGLQDLTSESPRVERKAFWTRALQERPLLSTGLLREVDRLLEARFGFTQLDVDWEALFTGATGTDGFVLVFRPGTDMAAVQRAVDKEVGPLTGASVDVARRMVSLGTTQDAEASLAADPDTAALVGLPANATYLATDCVDQTPALGLEDLGAFSVQFEGTLVTARLGEDRTDLFERMRLGADIGEFAASFDGGVADPGTGRIGYRMSDPAAAAELALAGRLPFATCA
jgi:hypothetical protein